MAELVTTKEMLVALDHILKKAEKFVCIFTFNIKIDENYMARLRNASKRGVKITIVFGVENGSPDVVNALQALENCTVYFKPYLHAKFYYNEKELLVGSMNLSEASSVRNFELGVLFKDEAYKNIITKVKAEAREIISDSIAWEQRGEYVGENKKKIALTAKEPTKVYGKSNKSTPVTFTYPSHGYCIRCQTGIPFHVGRPLCYSCFGYWQEWENEYYEELYDHLTGEPTYGKNCFAKPILQKNWRKEFEVPTI